MRIAICDDDKNLLDELEQKLCKYDITNIIESYFEIERFFSDLEAGERYDLVFLDLYWGDGETGLGYGERLYNIAPHLPVILVTGFNDRFAQHILLRKVNLVGYLTKPIDEILLDKYLKRVMLSSGAGKNITFRHQSRIVSIDVKDIMYIESSNHNCIVYTDKATYTVYEKLSSLYARLPNTFVQCHKSYVVNMSYIQRFDSEKILLKTGELINVSRTFRSKTKEAVFNYMESQI